MKTHYCTLAVCLLSLAFTAASTVDENPFAGSRKFYVNPSYDKNIERTIQEETRQQVMQTLEEMKGVPSAYWIDVKAKTIQNDTDTNVVSGILADAKNKGNQLVLFMVYDLPNRDCHAHASNGEICCHKKTDGSGQCNYDMQDSVCDAGLSEYRDQYINPFYEQLKRFPTVPVVLVIEPDSLPNLATNQPLKKDGSERENGDPRCGKTTKAAYVKGVTYAVEKFSTLPNTYIYIDAGHGGWLGWDVSEESNSQGHERQLFRDEIIAPMTTSHGKKVTDLIRGFATNVANYQPLGQVCPAFDTCKGPPSTDPCCKSDPCKLSVEYNPAIGEHTYVQALAKSFEKFGRKFGYLIDTGRNGVPGPRDSCSSWCNIRGAGIGLKSGSRPEKDLPDVDAYYWLKTPGESDGCTEELPGGEKCPRFDLMCASGDSIGAREGEVRAPEAGHWFMTQIKELALNADLSYQKAPEGGGTKAPASNPASPIPSTAVNPQQPIIPPPTPPAPAPRPGVPGTPGAVVPGTPGAVVPGTPGAPGTPGVPAGVPGAPSGPSTQPDGLASYASSLSSTAMLTGVVASIVGFLLLH